MKIANLDTTSARGQVILILLAALVSMKGGRNKQEVLRFIKAKQWFDIQPEDLKPYSKGNSREPRWETLIAWGRKDALEARLLEGGIRDNWELSKDGHNKFIEIRDAYRAQTISVRECFLWTPEFKKQIDSSWSTDAGDKTRPKYIYEDLLPPWMNSTRGSKSTQMLQSLMDEVDTFSKEDNS